MCVEGGCVGRRRGKNSKASGFGDNWMLTFIQMPEDATAILSDAAPGHQRTCISWKRLKWPETMHGCWDQAVHFQAIDTDALSHCAWQSDGQHTRENKLGQQMIEDSRHSRSLPKACTWPLTWDKSTSSLLITSKQGWLMCHNQFVCVSVDNKLRSGLWPQSWTDPG